MPSSERLKQLLSVDYRYNNVLTCLEMKKSNLELDWQNLTKSDSMFLQCFMLRSDSCVPIFTGQH